MSAPPKIAVVGMAWYRQEDWPALRELFVDADKLHTKWEDWQRIATSPLTEASILYWADRLRIAPGIIVGRLQNEGVIPWKSALNRLKIRYEWLN